MKKLITIFFLFLSVLAFSQQNGQNITIGKGKLAGMLYNNQSGATDTIIALFPDSLGQFKIMNVKDPDNALDAVNLRYFNRHATSWDSIVNNSKGFAVIWQHGTRIDSFECVTVQQFMDSLAILDGGHAPVTLNASATNGGLVLVGQEIGYQAAGSGTNGYLTSVDWNTFNLFKLDSANVLHWSDTLNLRTGVASKYDVIMASGVDTNYIANYFDSVMVKIKFPMLDNQILKWNSDSSFLEPIDLLAIGIDTSYLNNYFDSAMVKIKYPINDKQILQWNADSSFLQPIDFTSGVDTAFLNNYFDSIIVKIKYPITNDQILRWNADSSFVEGTILTSQIVTHQFLDSTLVKIKLPFVDGQIPIWSGDSGFFKAGDFPASMIQTLSTTGGAGNVSISSGNTITLNVNDADASVTNEGSLTVGAGTSTTALIQSNSSGSTPITIEVDGTSLGISESGNKITLSNLKPVVDGVYEPVISPKNTGFNKPFGTTTGTVLQGRTFGSAANNNTSDFESPLTFSIGLSRTGNTISNTITQYTDALARGAISLTTSGTSGAATYNNSTGVLNIPNYAVGTGGTSLNGNGYVFMTGTTPSYDNTVFNSSNIPTLQQVTTSGKTTTTGITSTGNITAPNIVYGNNASAYTHNGSGDLNLIYKAGFYTAFSGTNAPAAGDGGFINIPNWGTQSSSTRYNLQIYGLLSSNKLWFRNTSSDGSGTWNQIYHSTNSNSTSIDWSSNVNNSLQYNLNGTNINTVGTLSNVAYKGTLTTNFVPIYDGTKLINSNVKDVSGIMQYATAKTFTNARDIVDKGYVDNATTGGNTYLGVWDASSNTPTLSDATGSVGDMYAVSATGTRSLGSGSITWTQGGFAIHNGTKYEFVGTGAAVSSVNSYTGVVNLYPQLTGNKINILGNATDIDISTSTAVAANTAKVTNATHTGDVTGATELTLATVNSDVGTYNNVTVNGKGLVTGASNTPYLPLAGGTMANTNLVTNLNADLLDGFDSSNFYKINTTVPGFDLDTLKIGSYILIGGAYLNTPSQYGILRVVTNMPYYGLQEFTTFTNLHYTRTRAGTWGSWVKTYNELNSNLSTVDWSTKNLTANGTITATGGTSTQWNTAYSERNRWDGSATGLVAATGRTSLGGTTIGQALFTSPNPSAVRFARANADNTVSWLNANDFLVAIGAGTSTGTVSSVSMTVPTGLQVSGAPITTTGTLALTLQSGYSIPTTTKQGQWDASYSWGNHAGLYKAIGYVPTWSEITSKPLFSTVATTGSYNSLLDKPTIPDAQVNSNWLSGSGISQILNKPTKLSDFTNDLTTLGDITAVYAGDGMTGGGLSGDVYLNLNLGTLANNTGATTTDYIPWIAGNGDKKMQISQLATLLGTSQWNNDASGISYSSGNVGIGIAANPSTGLYINKNISSGVGLFVYNSSSSGGGIETNVNSSSSAVNSLYARSNAGTGLKVRGDGKVFMPKLTSSTKTNIIGFDSSTGELTYFPTPVISGLELGITSTTAYRGDYGNTAYLDRFKWDGNATGLNAVNGRVSLGFGATPGGVLGGTWANPTLNNGTVNFDKLNATVFGGMVSGMVLSYDSFYGLIWSQTTGTGPVVKQEDASLNGNTIIEKVEIGIDNVNKSILSESIFTLANKTTITYKELFKIPAQSASLVENLVISGILGTYGDNGGKGYFTMNVNNRNTNNLEIRGTFTGSAWSRGAANQWSDIVVYKNDATNVLTVYAKTQGYTLPGQISASGAFKIGGTLGAAYPIYTGRITTETTTTPSGTLVYSLGEQTQTVPVITVVGGAVTINTGITSEDARLNISENTIITLKNVMPKQTGNITIINSSTTKNVSFVLSGATINISPSLNSVTKLIPIPNGKSVLSYDYDGIDLFINGTTGYE